MQDKHLITSPLHVPCSSKEMFTLNLNNYRNTHYRALNAAKRNYHYSIWEQVKELPYFEIPIYMNFIWVPGDHRKYDRSNILSIHEKFFMDALVKGNPYILREKNGKITFRQGNKLEDDCDKYVAASQYSTAEIDAKKARVEIVVFGF